ncbi:MAG: FtsX-like permease family protein [Candidatus Hodarchaeota archaeon]
MRIIGLPFKSLKRNKNQNVITMIALSLAIVSGICVNMAVNSTNNGIKNYYEPVKQYNIIVEKKASFTQYIPLNSEINQSTLVNLSADLGIPLNPVIFDFLEWGIQAVVPNILAGFPLELFTEFFKDFIPIEGKWPSNGSYEVVIGYAYKKYSDHLPEIGETINISSTIVEVVGRINFRNAILDNFLITTLGVAQDISGLMNKCNAIYIDKSKIDDESQVESLIENNYTGLKFLNGAEIDAISNDITSMFENWNNIFLLLVLFVNVSFSFTIFLINYKKIKREIMLLRSLGTPRHVLFGSKLMENVTITLISLLLGVLLSFFVYPMLLVQADLVQSVPMNAYNDYWHEFIYNIPDILSISLPYLALIASIGLLISSLPYFAVIGENKQKVEIWNEKR